jgi:SagB-type dehydrogenase family enzyme
LASFTERYHELTKYNPHTIDKLGTVHWDTQPPAFKSISSKEKIELLPHLQAVIDELQQPFEGTAGSESSLSGIARLLFFTLGLTARFSDQGGEDFFLRAAPSAGGLYPTEIYVAARNQTGLVDGLYHYHSLKSALIPVWQGSFWGDLKHYFLGNTAVESSNLIFLFTGIYGRSAWRYKERAYRRILLDSGHAVANLLEVCRHQGLDYSLMGGFLDDGLEELLFLTAKEEFPLLGIAIGPRGTLPRDLGQYPSDPPEQAVRHLSVQNVGPNSAATKDAMQVQQNSCERIRSVVGLRKPVEASSGGPPFLLAPQSDFNVLKTILGRRSCRKFTGKSISLAQAKENLAFAFKSDRQSTRLTSDSLEFHLVALNIEGLASGVYHFHPDTLALESQRAGDFKSETLFMCLGQDLASDCAFALVHTANISALAKVYGDRGYRYACLDAGQIGERINLWAVHQGLGSSGIGGYYDDKANELLGLPLSHGILYITLVGVPEES